MPPEASVWVDVADFETALDRVQGHPEVQLTFDDGNVSDVEIALPLLLARDLTARFFVLAGRLEEEGFLAPDDIRELLRRGMQLGSHGLSHRDWRTLNDAELTRELTDARRDLETVAGGTLCEVSCPFGSYDRRVLRHIREAGYERVYTSDGGWAKESGWLQARNTLVNGQAAVTTERLLGARSSRDRLGSELRRTVKRWR
jgi:peptidoglycan/xylan/chitin deacetylase (PgdA/CDA1 family)